MKDINDLRATLFETMQDVRSGKVDRDHAKLVADLGQVLVNTAKVEVDFIKATGETGGTGFVAITNEAGGTQVIEGADKLPDGVTRIVRHKIAG